jgi:hypothetical protein
MGDHIEVTKISEGNKSPAVKVGEVIRAKRVVIEIGQAMTVFPLVGTGNLITSTVMKIEG